jgi:hypothetical protein
MVEASLLSTRIGRKRPGASGTTRADRPRGRVEPVLAEARLERMYPYARGGTPPRVRHRVERRERAAPPPILRAAAGTGPPGPASASARDPNPQPRGYFSSFRPYPRIVRAMIRCWICPVPS